MRLYTKEKSLAVLEKELDLVFGQFIAYRDFNGGWKCFVCGKSISSKGNGEVGHFIRRQHLGTRYIEKNCHFICLDCNRFDQQHEYKYTSAIVIKYGTSILDELNELKRSLLKPMRSDIQRMIDLYKEKVKELKKQKGL